MTTAGACQGITLYIEGMNSSLCQKAIEAILHALPGLYQIKVDIETSTASFLMDKTVELTHIKDSIRTLGFQV